MILDPTDLTVLRRFLLGDCTEAERDAIEERLMTDDFYFEEFELVKEEVVDQYAEGEMIAEDRQKFQRYFLTTPERHLNLRLAKSLVEYNWLQDKGEDNSKTKVGRTGFPWLRPLFSTPLRSAAAISVAVVVAIVGWMLYFSSSTLSEGLQALNEAYREQRPIQARVSDFQYAPWANTRSGDEVKFDRAARSRAEVLLHSAADKQAGSASEHALGKLLLFQGQYDDAIPHLEAALKTDSKNPRIRSDLGVAWLQRGELEVQKGEEGTSSESFGKSLEQLQLALELDPSLLEALFNRALVREQLKLFKLAQEDWKAYIEKDSTSPWADEAKQKLKALQEQSVQVPQSADQIFQAFLNARQIADDQTAWKLLIQSRDFRGSSIENRLLDEYLLAATSGRTDEARERIQSLTYAGEVGQRVVGEHFTSDLTTYYSNLPSHKQIALIEARKLMRSAHEQLDKDNSAEALRFYSAAGRLFEENGNIGEALLSKYMSAHSRLLQGESQESLDNFEQVKREAEVRRYRWFEGQSLNALANVHIGLNNYSLALDLSQRSLKILDAIGDIKGVAKVYDQVGVEYLRLGNPREALKFHRRAATLAATNSLGTGALWRTYFLAAVPFKSLGLTAAGIDLTRESLWLADSNNQAPLNVSRSCAHLALMYGSRGNYAESMAYIQRSVASAKQIVAEKVRVNALGYASLQMGNLHKQAGSFSRATESYDEAIRLFDQLNFSAFSYVAHKGKFLSCVAQHGTCQSVENELRIAMNLYEAHRSKILETRNRYSFFDTEQDVYDVAIDYEFSSKNDKTQAFDYSERCRARTLLDPADVKEHPQGHHPVGEERPAEPDSLSVIRRTMPEQAQILQYAVLSDKLLIWVISRNRFEAFQQSISIAALEETVLNYLSLLESRSTKDEAERQRQSAELFDLLIKPIEHLLDKDRLLCIVPDKVLNRLPYSSLLSKPEGRYLFEDYALTFSPSSTVFVRQSRSALERGGPRPERVLSVGDPRFDPEAFPSYRRLPAAEVEAQTIGKMYDSHEIFIGGDATKDRVIRAMKIADVIHLATHAVVDQFSPMYSKLLLAKPTRIASGEDADGVLLTSEIYKLDFQARLVVLPACRTGMEQYYGGEGMVGIWSPFITRNVPLVVASLWSVDSDSTQQLMISFHRFRREGYTSANALRQAQIEMLHGDNSNFHHPYHWAAFIPIGGYTQF